VPAFAPELDRRDVAVLPLRLPRSLPDIFPNSGGLQEMNDYRNNDWSPRSQSPRDEGDPHPPHPSPSSTDIKLAPPLPRPRVSRRSTSQRHSSSSRRKLRQLRLVIAGLLSVIVVGAIAAMLGYAQYTRLKGELEDRSIALRRAETDLARARERLTDMNNDLRVLLANRIPGITQVRFGEPAAVNNRYVKNLTLLQPIAGDNRTINFNAILENERPDPVLPQATIMLFDEVGLEIGSVTLEKQQAGSAVTIPELLPGETRQYSGTIHVKRPVPARYFLVDAR
jgi:hypothetical protein